MLPLPKGLKIDRDLEEEARLLSQVRAYLEKEEREPGIHVSGLMDPRLDFWRKVSGSPIPDRLLNMFMVGKVAHGLIELIGGAEHGKSDAGGRTAEDIWYSPDEMHVDGTPVEIKTTRSFYLPKAAYLPDDDTFHMYFEQLLAYMALEGKTKGRLKILYLNSKDEEGRRTKPNFFVWSVETTPEALDAFRAVLTRTRLLLEDALATGDHTNLPLCRAWKCQDCEFWEKCKPEGRYGVDKKLWLKRSKDDKE